ncbi:MAG: NAD-dependent epimerase/dehydratase family protein [Bacteroidales bacterium]
MKAIIIGASGLIGKKLLSLIENDNYFDIIEVWARKPLKTNNHKTVVKIIDFNQFPDMTDTNAVFCCIGTTIKKAGSQEAFRKVDFDIPVSIAEQCQKSKVEKLFVISSLGANQASGNNYLKTKGEMEIALTLFNIPTIIILRPSMLLGKREEFRFGELIGKFIIQFIGFFLLGKMKKYRGIQALTVAHSMLNIAKKSNTGITILESDKIENLGR